MQHSLGRPGKWGHVHGLDPHGVQGAQAQVHAGLAMDRSTVHLPGPEGIKHFVYARAEERGLAGGIFISYVYLCVCKLLYTK